MGRKKKIPEYEITLDKEDNVYQVHTPSKGNFYYPRWKNACYYTISRKSLICIPGFTIYGYNYDNEGIPKFEFMSNSYREPINFSNYPGNYTYKTEYIKGHWNSWLLKEKNDLLAINLMLKEINYPECKSNSFEYISKCDIEIAHDLFEYRKTLTDEPYKYINKNGELVEYTGKEDNNEMISKVKLKAWWEDYMYKEISKRLYNTRPAEVLDDIDTSIRKNFIGWNTSENEG